MMSLFVELIQVALGTRTVLSRIPSENDWQQIYEIAAKLSLVGVVLSGIEVIRAKNVELRTERIWNIKMSWHPVKGIGDGLIWSRWNTSIHYGMR